METTTKTCCFGCCRLKTGSVLVIGLMTVLHAYGTFNAANSLFDHYKRGYEVQKGFYLQLFTMSVSLVICFLALYGLKKKRRMFLLPFIVLLVVRCVQTLIRVGVHISDAVESAAKLDRSFFVREISPALFTGAIGQLVYSYFITVISLSFKEMGMVSHSSNLNCPTVSLNLLRAEKEVPT